MNTLAARVARSITVDDNDCWNWRLSTDASGYGRIKVKGRLLMAHRVSYEASVGPIPDGLQLDHLCRNRACANPDHLEPVTQRENVLRGISFAAKNSRKTHCLHGHPLVGDNVRVRPSGRGCRTCHRARAKTVA